ncbi:hypothetical protein C1893_01690 [Pseudomonas sp. MPR-ANC1]|uniref:hypothetical protein n=1 Tax=Pseudomonas sp. MPR-ANC1 TaxID=2075548 RepID=UPI000CD1F3D1|nr:hypothetical protein [Pseudomonas sp. MPR-ANC1]POA50290.1 hypothetical protein C1893_01690 [Pseudomonas sp. MPR-ANC1]
MLLIRTFFISAMLASSMVQAAEEDPCKVYDTAAKGAMEYRQKGRNLSEALAVLDKQVSKTSDPVEVQVNSTLRLAYIEAFKQPRYSTEQMKVSAISDFRNDFYSGCLKAMTEKRSP